MAQNDTTSRIWRHLATLFACFSAISILAACKCETACEHIDSNANQGPRSAANFSSTAQSSASGSSSSESTDAPSLSYLNCSNLDPDEVYTLGDIGTDTISILFNINDNTNYCAGFGTDLASTSNLALSQSGEIIGFQRDHEGRGPSAFIVNQDDLDSVATFTTDTGWRWADPENYRENDEYLFSLSAPHYSFFIAQNPERRQEDIYYQRYRQGEIFLNGPVKTSSNDWTGEPYYNNPNSLTLVDALPRGMLLLTNSFLEDQPPKLFALDQDLNETEIQQPGGQDFRVLGRAKGVPGKGESSAWLVAQEIESGELYRWQLNLNTLKLINEGKFVSLPPNMTNSRAGESRIITSNLALNFQGDLIQHVQIIQKESSAELSALVRTPLESESSTPEVLRREDDLDDDYDWQIASPPEGRIGSGGLITGY